MPNEKTTNEAGLCSCGTVHNLVILDASGSMQSIARPTVDGTNETIQTIRQAAVTYADTQRHKITLVTFNSTELKYLYRNADASDIREITDDEYRPLACTPLYDAMGVTITALEKEVKEGDHVLVTIITDGYENASKEYSQKEIKHMTERLRKKGWSIAYIGANQDAEHVSRGLGLKSSMSWSAKREGTGEMFHKTNEARSKLYKNIHGFIKNLVCEDEISDVDLFADD